MTDDIGALPEPQPGPEVGPPAVAPVEGGQPAEAGTSPAAPPNVLPTAPPPKSYTARFALAYIVLGIALAAAITGLIVLVIRPGHHAAPPWSTWKPSSANQTTGTKQIADHVAGTYHLAKKGGQLLAVLPGKAAVTNGTKSIAIKYVAVRKAPQSNTGIAVFKGDNAEMYTLCGLGQYCSIAKGKATERRGRLVRREALELALYTFKFIPKVDSVAAFMPPPPGQTATQMLYLQKSDLKDQLKQPIDRTLPAGKTPLPTDADTPEAATIDRLTLPHLFTYSLQPLQGGGAVLILDPAT
jgi:hypothetical protein